MIEDENKVTLSTDRHLKAQRMSTIRNEGQQTKKALLEKKPLTNCLMEKICERSNLNQAYKRVKANKGAPGIDGMKVEEMREFIAKHKEKLVESLLNGSYQPKPVREVEIPKANGGVRQLGIPTVIDRLIQQAILQILQPIYEQEFSDSSYGFRPGRSAHQAIQRAQSYVQAGNRVVVDIDLEKFFDRVNHDILMSTLAKRISDKRLLKIIRAFLNAGIMRQGVCVERDEGTPQGGNLSPLLSNIMLDGLDKELEKRGHKFCRYADDCNIYVKTVRAGKRVMSTLKTILINKLKLKINETKSAVAVVNQRQFLGYCLLTNGKLGLPKKSKERLKETVRKLTKRNRGVSLERVICELNVKLRGWINYFRYVPAASFRGIDSWIKRRLRCYRLKQRKRSYPIALFLIELGVNRRSAWNTAKSGKGWWRLSGSPALNQAMSNKWFEEMRLINLQQRAILLTV